MLDRATLQTLTTNLDTNAITLAAAKTFVRTNYGKAVKGATRDQFIRNLAREIDGAAMQADAGPLFAMPSADAVHAFKVRIAEGQGEGHVTFTVQAADRGAAFKRMVSRLDENGTLPTSSRSNI